MPRAGEWWDDAAELRRRLDEHGGSMASLSRAENVAVSTLKSARERHRRAGHWGASPVDDPTVIVVDVDHIDDLDAVLAERGMRREDWIVTNVIVNKYEGFAKSDAGEILRVPLRQLKVTLRPRLTAAMLQPAEPVPLKFASQARPGTRRSKGRLVFVYGDDQRPNHDLGFEQAKLAWIKQNQPDTIVDLGDGMDFATVSQHKPNPAHNHSVQACANSYASWLYTARLAAPDAEIVVLADNHVTQRWRDYQLSQAAALYGVKPAEIEGLADDLEPLLSIRRLLRLDEMNVRYLAPEGDTHYAESQYEIVPGELVALHGYRTGNNVGRKLLDDFGVSVIYGHVHGQDVTVTDQRRRGIGDRKRLYALGVGCGAVVHGGIGFAPGSDWQNCCLVVTVHDDGGWTWDYLSYEHGVMRWRDQRYEAA